MLLDEVGASAFADRSLTYRPADGIQNLAGAEAQSVLQAESVSVTVSVPTP